MAKKNDKPFEGDGANRFFSMGDIHQGKQSKEGKKAADALNRHLGIGKYAKKKTATKKTSNKK